MTDREKSILNFIREYMKLHGTSPSYEVIAKAVGLKSKSNVHRFVHKLEDLGYLKIKPYKFRSIKVIDRSAMEIGAL